MKDNVPDNVMEVEGDESLGDESLGDISWSEKILKLIKTIHSFNEGITSEMMFLLFFWNIVGDNLSQFSGTFFSMMFRVQSLKVLNEWLRQPFM